MPTVPVLCQSCDSLFRANVLDGAIFGNTRLGNNPIPCPFCGSMGYTLEGLYSSIGETVQIIVNSLNSEKSLSLLAKKLNDLKPLGVEPHLYKEKIKQDVPEFTNIADTLPKTRSELYAFITVLLAAISILISTHAQFYNSSKSITKENVKEIVKEAINKTITDTALLQDRNSKSQKTPKPDLDLAKGRLKQLRRQK